MKRLIASALCAVMLTASLTGCGDKPAAGDNGNGGFSGTSAGEVAQVSDDPSVTTLNVYAFTDEVPKMIDRYVATHPDFKLKVNTTIVATTDGLYQPALDQALQAGGADAPDIYCAEAAFILKYAQGDASGYAASYKELGIDVDKMIKDADIANYSVQIGTRGDGAIVGLGYQATGGAFIYRRSIAKDVWGSDDPATVKSKIGGGSGNWDQFWTAAADLKAKGYAIISGDGDLWHAVENSADSGWIVDGKLNIDPKREKFLDYSKQLVDNGWSNKTTDWTDAWYADMKDANDQKVFGFFGPAWLINYVMAGNSGGSKIGEGTYGDWAICESPVGFFWGGTWILANKDSKVKKSVGDIISWITLESDENSLQYAWANATVDWDNDPETPTSKDSVASGTVMAKSDGKLDFLNGQNMFDVFVPANAYANGKNMTQYDETINQVWRDQVKAYANGEKSREDAIKDFKQQVGDKLDITVD